MSLRIKQLIYFMLHWSSGFGFTCLDFNANPVDWYSVYKSPKISTSSDRNIQRGLGHFYLDVNSPAWQLSPVSMNETHQAVGITLSTAIYNSQNDDSSMYIMYNDEHPIEPSNASFRSGHTKGVVAFDKTSGFWLIHSVPKFPPVKADGYRWPKNGLDFGQTFLCVSFKYEELGKIATQLWYNQPSIYEKIVPQSFLDDFQVLENVINGKQVPSPWNNIIQLTSLRGQQFTSFAKAAKFNNDLYVGLVAPTLKQNLLVETWLREKGEKLDSNCTVTYKVMKVASVTLPGNLFFNERKDHSKWAVNLVDSVSTHKVLKFQTSERWTCIGDINRMKSQFKRGGGTLCLLNSSLWSAYRNLVSSYDKCPSPFKRLMFD